MDKVKIMMLEPTEVGRELLLEFYRIVFSKLGYEIEIRVLPHSEEEEENDIDKSILETDIFTADIFITDVSLGKQDSNDGLTIVKKIKRQNPNLFVIAQSRSNITLGDAASHKPGFDLFIYKPNINDEDYIEYVVHKLDRIFKRNIYLSIDNIDFPKSKILKKTLNKLYIFNMLKEITFSSHTVTDITAVYKIRLQSMTGGYSGSEVFRLFSFTKTGQPCINAVLKLSKVDHYLEEKSNYLKYVKWYLPYTWRPELIGDSQSCKYGALCYSFIYNDEVSFKSLTDYLKDSDTSKLDIAINHIFSPSYQQWYHENNFKKADNITKYYVNRWFKHKEKDSPPFKEFIALNSERQKRDTFIINKFEYECPKSYLFGIAQGEYTTSIRHGDLNSNNILISTNDNVSFIDFQDTGRGHVFEDFVVFEGCVRLNMNFNTSFLKLLNIEYSFLKEANIVANENKVMNESYNSIKKLREYAIKNAPKEDFSNYVYSLSLYCYRLLRIPDLEEWQKSQLIACLLSSQRFHSEDHENKSFTAELLI